MALVGVGRFIVSSVLSISEILSYYRRMHERQTARTDHYVRYAERRGVRDTVPAFPFQQCLRH